MYRLCLQCGETNVTVLHDCTDEKPLVVIMFVKIEKALNSFCYETIFSVKQVTRLCVTGF